MNFDILDDFEKALTAYEKAKEKAAGIIEHSTNKLGGLHLTPPIKENLKVNLNKFPLLFLFFYIRPVIKETRLNQFIEVIISKVWEVSFIFNEMYIIKSQWPFVNASK